MATSSANPDKLATYASEGRGLTEALRTKSNALTTAIDALSGSSSPHVPALGDAHVTFADLAGDWQHLDEFVGAVGRGFRAADSGAGVVSVDDATVLRLGRVGFADRDEAVRAAQDAKRRLDELLRQNPEEIDRAELDRLFADIQRGQNDTAFAVTFSNSVGVQGYVDAMALIRNVYTTTDPTWRVTDQGMSYAAVLGATLTTALRTADHTAPGYAYTVPGDRISQGFVDDLVSGYRGGDHARSGAFDPEHPEAIFVRRISNGASLDRDLSVLLSFTDPPTQMAVDIANHRLSPLLENYASDVPISGSYGGSDVNIWGNRSGVVTNYATMLGRNSDASTYWLADTADGGENDNLRLVLERAGQANHDGGQALALVVQNGLTNENVHQQIPGAPSYVQGRPMRELLMGRAIDDVGEMGEIVNPNLTHAFALGVDANMNVIDERVNAPFYYDEGERPEGLLPRYHNTHIFLRETMGDPEAARDIRQSIHAYGLEQVGQLPSDPHQLEVRLRQLGRIQGMATEAEYNAQVGGALNSIMSDSVLGPTPGSATNYAISWIPFAGKVNDIAAGMGVGMGNWLDAGLGELLPSDYDTLDSEQQMAAVRRASDKLERSVWLATGMYGADTPDGAALRASAQGQSFVNPDGSLKTSMTPEEACAFRGWALQQTGSDGGDRPIYTETGDVQAGAHDVQEGETDVRDRR